MSGRCIFGLMFLFVAGVAHSKSDCDSVLVQRNVTSVQDEAHLQLAWLQMINRDNYEEAKASGSALVPGLFDSGYDSFAQKRSSLRKRSSFDLTTRNSRSILQSLMDENAVKKWAECMKDRGLYTRVGMITPTDIQLEIFWDPADGLGDLRDISIDLPPGVTAKDLGKLRTLSRGKHSYVLRRSKNTQFLASIRGVAGLGGGYSDSIYVPWAYELGDKETMGDSPQDIASGAGGCGADTYVVTGNAEKEVFLRANTTAVAGRGGGTIAVNITVDSDTVPSCAESGNTQSGNMGVTANCKRTLPANRILHVVASQTHTNADCRNSTTTVKVLH
ncbi:MAG: hypothetical protein AAGI27_03565 [Pseudomonadota bacterium]